MKIKVITGASYGDEGKGLMTDFFCRAAASRGERCAVVCHNGGAQRGHTVISPEGRRYVFHHLGSGTFSGAHTFFSEDFIINPMMFGKETAELGMKAAAFRSPLCKWSTPFDMMINQIAEEARGSKRHGSCGFGIWETQVRYMKTVPVSIDDFVRFGENKQIEYLKSIRDVYLPQRLRRLGVDSISEEWREVIFNDGLMYRFIDDCRLLADMVKCAENKALESYDTVVFEGGQGLLLGQSVKDVPEEYTTPSFTGGENPVKIIKELSEAESIEVCYVTRTYLTRHGAGPFPGECVSEDIAPCLMDLTNIPNDYQGTLRYGRLDIKSLNERTDRDFALYRDFAGAKKAVAVTHLNETGGRLAAVGGREELGAITADRLYTSSSESTVN